MRGPSCTLHVLRSRRHTEIRTVYGFSECLCDQADTIRKDTRGKKKLTNCKWAEVEGTMSIVGMTRDEMSSKISVFRELGYRPSYMDAK